MRSCIQPNGEKPLLSLYSIRYTNEAYNRVFHELPRCLFFDGDSSGMSIKPWEQLITGCRISSQHVSFEIPICGILLHALSLTNNDVLLTLPLATRS